jgi:hypothetical protein
MKREVWWSPVNETGLEHLQLNKTSDEIIAEGLILRVLEHKAFRLSYQIFCDKQWRVRKAEISRQSDTHRKIELNTDGAGNWTDKAGHQLSGLKGCLDIDITATPFTNTLPIRRLNLKPNESAVLKVLYIIVPEMKIERVKQQYTCLEILDSGGRIYKYESLDTNFSADLKVDSDGLVINYPDLFNRI